LDKKNFWLHQVKKFWNSIEKFLPGLFDICRFFFLSGGKWF
jgi:hypothetical protein